MKRNMGAVDRTIRILLALIVLALYLSHMISGLVAIILGIVALVFLLTGVFGSCPGYVPLKWSTRKEKSQ
jgi:hypothetical protein